jgi:glycosyltransferase involved in cell wall biosynthesis
VPRFSVVIPAYNEARYLPRLLDSLEAAIAAYPGGRAAMEIVVADNASTDETAAIARSRGCVVAAVEKRCIAAARNGGARAASGDIFCFVDADTLVHARTFLAIDETLARPGVAIGATSVVAERYSLPIALIFGMLRVVMWAANLDGGVVFCRKADFERCGGYDEHLMIAEDVRFLRDMKRLGRFGRARGARAIMSVRKCDARGDWHLFTLGPRVLWQMVRSTDAMPDFVRAYWYDDRR